MRAGTVLELRVRVFRRCMSVSCGDDARSFFSDFDIGRVAGALDFQFVPSGAA